MSDPIRSGWVDPSAFPACRLLEEQAPIIREELEQILTKKVWAVWKEGPYTPDGRQTTVGEGEPSWRLFGLYLRGRPIEAHCRACPKTAAVLARIPRLTKAGFSCLEAGYVMEPHIGHDPKNYRIHLGLIVPEGDCGLRVSGEARHWEVGKVTMFDDTFIHEAWNRTASHRFVLIVDVLK